MHSIVRSLAIAIALSLLAGVAHADKAKPKAKPKTKSSTFHGMVVLINGTGATATVDIKHENGSIRTFAVDGKTKIAGQGVTGLQGLRKGQIVKVNHTGPHAGKIDVEKKAPAGPKLTGAQTTFHGKVTHAVADQYGDNGNLTVKDAKGVTKKFDVHNQTGIDYKWDGKTITHTLQGIHPGLTVTVKSVGNDAVHIDVNFKPGTFHGMLVQVTGTNGAGHIIVKHANGTGRGYHVDTKTTVGGLSITGVSGMKKGQIVKVDHFGRHATAITVEKQAAPNPKLVGATGTFQGTVEKVVSDKFGDNGQITVQDINGTTKTFEVHNETNIDYKKDGKVIVHTLQGVAKGMMVNIDCVGKDAVHIDCIMAE